KPGRRALDHRQARTVHGNPRADVAALERHARLHAEPDRGDGACERDDGPHFLDDPGEHLFKVGGSDAAPPDRPPPVTHGGPIRKSIAPAKPALERPHSDQPPSSTSRGATPLSPTASHRSPMAAPSANRSRRPSRRSNALIPTSPPLHVAGSDPARPHRPPPLTHGAPPRTPIPPAHPPAAPP